RVLRAAGHARRHGPEVVPGLPASRRRVRVHADAEGARPEPEEGPLLPPRAWKAPSSATSPAVAVKRKPAGGAPGKSGPGTLPSASKVTPAASTLAPSISTVPPGASLACENAFTRMLA